MKHLLIGLCLLIFSSQSFASFEKENEIFEQLVGTMAGVSGFGSVNSGECDDSNPCLNVYLKTENDLKNIKTVFPHGIKINGVVVRFSVLGELSVDSVGTPE